ncbi:conserved hypothetical protein [Culex quinquefasciatus]|uniref:Tox-SGS domain-containing protein n=1 Tax=Culex quinquefasciatus TaxID=7176 RepID=B0XA84_CULQU|nr:conserved hypothetical protein [Culex quinquefasciatus]|eukprot:XP_001866556.1 conserved hypothetical protein [Culex quinquefasciatus]
MEGLHLKWLSSTSLATIKLSSGEESNSVSTGDWTFVRSDTSLVAFTKDSGGSIRVTKQYDNVFNTPHYYRFFPWTVCQMKSDGKFVLVVRDREGMASYELLEKGKVEMRIGMADVAAEKFEEDTPENTVIIINLQKSDGILVKITEYGVQQMYKLNLATRNKILAQVGTGDETNYLEAAGASDYHFFRVAGNKFIGYTLNSNFDENESVIADKIEVQVPLKVLQVFATKLESLDVYLFASTLGLYVYKLEQKLLKHVCFNQQFSANEGWTMDHWKTVKIVYVNSYPHLVFTGPKGVGVCRISESCENVRILDAEFPLEQIHGTVLAANLLDDGKLELLSLNSNSIDSITVSVQEPAKTVTTAEKPIVIPNYSSMISLDTRFHLTNQPPVKPSLWLGETLDTASIADGVDRTTGQLSFTLPIIDLRSKFGVPIRHTFYFNQPEDGTGVDPGVLGKYWSRSMDFIYVDRKDTVFEDEFEYFLVSDGTKVKLEWVRSDGGKEVFKFEDTVMKYHKNGDSGMWEVITKDLVCWYGDSESSIRWTLGWPNWNGKGADEGSVLKRPLEWHLSSAKSAVGNSVVQYEYTSEVVTVKDKVHYTKDIVLKTIEDKAAGISINFHYQLIEKSKETAREASKLKVVFEDTRQLSGFNLETNDFIQNFNLFQAGDAVICNSYKLFFDGQRFKTEPIPVEETKIKKLNLQIAKRIWMRKDSTDGDVQLIVENGVTKSLLVSRLDHLIVKPPVYVAFKVGEIHSLVKLEKSGTTVSEILNVQGRILKFSTERLLVTTYNGHVIITPIRAIDINNNFKVNVIVSEHRGISKVSYIYNPESSVVTGSNVAFKRVKIIPNGDFNYGSFEQVTNFSDRSRTINVLDSKNKTVVKDYKGPEKKGLKINSETDILTVTVGSKPIKAHVRDQINDWFHVEVLISPDNSANSNQRITITFKKGSHSFVEIDHVRLSPLDFSFRAIIFDEFRNNPIAVLRHNGRTVQYLYDSYGRKIGEVDERGSVTKLVIYSKQPAQNDVSSIVNLQPVSGFVESMSPYTVGLIWDFKGNWSFSPKRASIGSGSGTMKYKQSLTDCFNIGVRLMINRAQGGTLKIKFSSSDPGIDVSSLMSENYGEIAVARYKKFFSVWIDGHLKKEGLNQWSQSKELSIEVSGKVDLSDIVVMKDVDLMLEYNDAKGQPVQQISVEDDDHINMRGFVYDAVQRESVATVWTRRKIDELRGKVLEYKSDYIELKSGKVSGSIIASTKPLYQGYPFTMTAYLDCPLSIRQKVGIPGKENNIDSQRAVTYSKSTDNNFLMVLFPAMDGYRYEEQHLPNGANNTQVYDNRDRKVAEYVSVPKYDNILTTYQYDEAGNVVEVLQPNFHHAVDTRAKAAKFDEFLIRLDDAGKSLRIKQRERKQFDSPKRITLKQTPDAGLYRFLYDDFHQLRFVVHYKSEDNIDKVFFHKYTSSGEMFEFGVLDNERNLEQLKKYANDAAYPRVKANYIRFDYGNIDVNSMYRNRKQSSLKVDKTGSTTEALYFNDDGNVLLKSYFNPLNANKTIDVSFGYERNNVKEIVYPAKFEGSNLVVSYTYNFKGQVIAIGTRAKPRYFAEIKQNPFGKVEEMWYTPKDKHNFTVRLRYNAAGNMVSMDSKFLKEDLDYEAGKGYNANNAGDGSILRTTFEAKWHDKCNRKLLRISISELIKSELKFSVASKCIDELRKKGYVDEASSPFKTMRKEIAGDPCLSGSTFRKLSSILIGKAFPRKYGHAYDYGSHGEMTVAKYFAGSEDPAVNILGNRMTMIANACPGDVESFDIDPNGNHKLLYTGNVRHKLTYKKHTNQIETVQLGANGKAFTFAHNSEGNVISAEYKNIISLEYDHVVDRVSKITMKGGTTIDLGYDIRGERTFKKVTTPSGKIIETYYIRDIKARCLMDMKLVYQDRSMKKPLITLTTYIHGPLGLLGFIRNNVFYSVIADHEGSTRLVVKNGEVVAAYDYLPYGGRMRFYNSDPEGYVAYQYTGQEFDEETGLYNYHARLYDPELGRFYQTDPKEEYPSPYKYAGNSPVMMTDPDGELALTVVCVITAIVGAYLAASASSNSWDPIKWNWKSGQMWLAMIGGTFAGAMLPIGAVETFSIFASIGGTLFASAATASLMMAGTYLGMAGASNDFNPANWDLSSPALYSGMLNGASLAINIPSGAVGITRAISTVSTSKTVYATAIFGTSLLFGYGSAFLENDMTWNPAQWDWNAQTVFAVFEGATFVFMETGAFIKRGPQKALFNHRYPGISTAPSKRWVKRFEQSECQYEVIQDGLQDEMCKIRWRQILTGSTDSISPAIPPPGLTKQFIAGLPEVKELSATVVIPDVMLREEYSMYKVYFSNLETIPLNATMGHKFNRRVKRFSSATSGGASLFDNIKRFFQFRADFLQNAKSTTEHPSTEVIEHTKRPTPNPIKIHSLTNCIAMNPDRSFYECFQSTAKVLLFAQNLSLESGSIPTGIDRCVPLHWHGQPSVGCKGQQFGFIYTPYEASKMFSFLDGWLMLARVGLQVVENWRQVEEKMERVYWNEEDVGKYYGQLGEIEDILNRNERKSFKWAKLQVEDMRSDLEEFKSRRSITGLAKMVFEEKLAALREDLLEEIKYMGSGSPFRVANANRVTSDNNNNYPTIRLISHIISCDVANNRSPGERRDKLPPTYQRWWNLLLIASSLEFIIRRVTWYAEHATPPPRAVVELVGRIMCDVGCLLEVELWDCNY